VAEPFNYLTLMLGSGSFNLAGVASNVTGGAVGVSMSVRRFIYLIVFSGCAGCVAPATLLARDCVSSGCADRGSSGELLVYSATYPQTLEQSEYPAHTDYTIATADDHVIERVSNATGTFASRPARVTLPAGEYHVRAQFKGGRFVTVPVVIEPGKTTVVDLDGQASIPTGI
jgi:hypothetical protein